jgi:serine/threonine-protein kinase
VVLWEALTGKRLFDGGDAGEIFAKLLATPIPEPKSLAPDVPDAMNDVVMKALERDPDRRYQTARQFAIELEGSVQLATPRTIGEWVERLAGADLERRAQLVAEIETTSTTPEDLVSLDDEIGAIEPLDEFDVGERSSTGSGARLMSGSRPRVERPSPPPVASSPGETDERSARSAVSQASASTAQVANVAISQPAKARGSNGMVIGAIAACVAGGGLAFVLFGMPKAPAYKPVTVPEATEAPHAAAATPPGAAAAPQPANALPTDAVNVQDLPPAPPEDDPPQFEVQHAAAGPKVAKGASGASGPAGPSTKSAPAPKPAAKPTAADCSPPFMIDANGIKHIKPGCM